MMRGLWVVGMVTVAGMAAGCSQTVGLKGYAGFGAPVDGASALSLSEAVAVAIKGEAKPVTVRATIGSVCKKRGCWMMLTDGRRDARVRFTASEQCTDGFFVPRNCAGRDAVVRGQIELKEIPEDLARHYAEDQGKSKAEIEGIVGPQPEYNIIATGVMIADGDTLEPPAS